MKNMTAAIFLTLLFFTVSAVSEETADGFNQNPEYILPASDSGTSEEAKPVRSAAENQAPEGRTEPHDLDTNVQAQNGDPANTPAQRSRRNSFKGKTVRTEYNEESRYAGERDRDLNDWENSNNPVSSKLPKASSKTRTYNRNSRNYRNYKNYKNYYWSDSYYYHSSSPRIRVYSNKGRTKIRVRSR